MVWNKCTYISKVPTASILRASTSEMSVNSIEQHRSTTQKTAIFKNTFTQIQKYKFSVLHPQFLQLAVVTFQSVISLILGIGSNNFFITENQM
jgi:hypothetical protein